MLETGKDAAQEHTHHPVVVGKVELCERIARGAEARVVEQAIEPPEGFDASRDGGFDVGLDGDIGAQKTHRIALRRGQRLALFLVDVGGQYTRALGHEALDARPADAARCARDECNFALKPSRHDQARSGNGAP